MDHLLLNGSPIFWQSAFKHNEIRQFEIWQFKSDIMYCERLRFGCFIDQASDGPSIILID